MNGSEKLWNMMKTYGNNLHVYKNINIDKLNGKPVGLFAWEQIKVLLMQHGVSYNWGRNLVDLRNNNLEEVSETAFKMFGKKLDNRVETSHYLIQHLRIPYLKTATLTTIAQIAYNAGQLRSHFKIPYISEFLYEYSNRKMDEIGTYIDSDAKEALDKYLTDDKLEEIQGVINKVEKEFLDKSQTGGNDYYNKYITYKHKYLNKKNRM